jgi:hypothetical protein
LIVVWWILMQGYRLLGVLALLTKARRTDPIAWLLAGTTLAGAAAAWLFAHPAASQIYFFMAAAPAGVLLTVWLMTDRSPGWRAPAIGLVLAATWVFVIPDTPMPDNQQSIGEWSWAIARPIIWTVAVAAAVCVVALLFRVRLPALSSGLVAAVLGLGLGSGLVTIKDRFVMVVDQQAPAAVEPGRVISADEMRAALWLDRNAGPDDVVATNVHCQPIDRPTPCDARAFWVSGLGGHRTVVESWGYSDATVAANGVNGLSFLLQPPPYPSVFDQNQEIFTGGDEADVADFKQRFGVRWLFADTRAGEVSPELARVAEVRYRSGPVTIYEVR